MWKRPLHSNFSEHTLPPSEVWSAQVLQELGPLSAPTKGVAISGGSGLVCVRPYGGFPVGYAIVRPSIAVKNRPAPARMLVLPGPPVSTPKKPFDPFGE